MWCDLFYPYFYIFSLQAETRLISSATFCSALVDESTDVANNAQLVVHLRCVKPGGLSTRFGGIVTLREKNAAAIRTAVENKCQDFHVQWKTCHLGTDGACVFIGCKTGVNKELCVCHRKALACLR